MVSVKCSVATCFFSSTSVCFRLEFCTDCKGNPNSLSEQLSLKI
jgi:hypothetical protein